MDGEQEKLFEELIKLMPEGWEQKARELGAFTRSRNIKDVKDLLLVVFMYLTNTPSFGKTAAILRLGEDIHLNKNAVYERIGKSEAWLGWLCQNICRRSGELAEKPEWLEGKRVCLIDASDEAVYGSKGSDYRLHYGVDLFTLQMVEMHLTGIKNGEKAANFGSFGANDIVIGDRAYGTLQSIEYLVSRGSGFVLRSRSDAFVVYTAQKTRVELADYFEGLAEHESGEVQLYYKFGASYRPIRICATRKSEEAERKGLESIKKTKNSKGRGEVSEKQELYNRYIIIAASLDESVKAAQITELYRMRWQIELVFKRLKSLFQYNEIPVKVECTARAWFYGKLLLAALCETIVNKGRFSPSGV
jgi:hypothetical protein